MSVTARTSPAVPALLAAAAIAGVLGCGRAGRATADAPQPAPAPGEGSVQPPAAVPLSSGWELRVLPRGRWRAAPVPGVVDPRPLPALYDGRVAVYRLRFTGPVAPPGYTWALRFERVRRSAAAWLNGVRLGTHHDPYSGFELPATGLRAGAPNELQVQVDYRRPRGRREPWWNWGGIDRPVTLVPVGRVRLRELQVRPRLASDPASGPARVTVAATVENLAPQTATVTVDARLTAPDRSQSEASRQITLGPRGHARVAFNVGVQGTAQLWSPDHPALYQAQVRALVGDRVEESDRVDVGLRSVEVRAGRLLLNGRPVVLHGAGILEDAPGHGDALTGADMDSLVAQLRSLGANVARSPYPLSDDLLGRLDAAGIMVWNDAPVIHADHRLAGAAGRAMMLGRLRRTLLATRNHPAVIVDSVADELSTAVSREPGARRYLDAAVAMVHALDPGRPAALDVLSYPGYPSQPAFRRFDLIGLNSYFGWYPGRRTRALPALGALGAFLEQSHRRYPAQALVLTEFGAEAFRHGSPAVKGTYEFQSRYAARAIGIAGSEPFMNGALYWTLRDYAITRHWVGGPLTAMPDNTIFHKGLVSYGGRPKPAFDAVRRAFAGAPEAGG